MSLYSLMEDEHIGSFWLRKYAIKGNPIDPKHLRPIITSRSWRLFPWLGDEFRTREILQNHTLLNMVRPTSIPYDTHVGAITRHFSDYPSITARYCPLCFIEQVSDKGFVWFKRQWLIYNSAHCLVHRCFLLTFRCDQCGVTPQIHAGIESFLTGRCNKCKSNCQKARPTLVEQIPPLTCWLNEVLKSNFPHFSFQLIRHLFHYSYTVLEKKVPAGREWIAWHIFKLYMEHTYSQAPSELIKVPEDSGSYYHQEYAKRNVVWGSDKIPLIMFWVAMIATFERYEEFVSFLNSVSVMKTDSWDRVDNIEFLDLA